MFTYAQAHINNQTNQKNHNQNIILTLLVRLDLAEGCCKKIKMSFEFLLEQVNRGCLPNLSWETVPKERGLVAGSSPTC